MAASRQMDPQKKAETCAGLENAFIEPIILQGKKTGRLFDAAIIAADKGQTSPSYLSTHGHERQIAGCFREGSASSPASPIRLSVSILRL
jgi:hypothetical protein